MGEQIWVCTSEVWQEMHSAHESKKKSKESQTVGTSKEREKVNTNMSLSLPSHDSPHVTKRT